MQSSCWSAHRGTVRMPGGDGAREARYGEKGECERGKRQRAKLVLRGIVFGTRRRASHGNRVEF